VIRLLSIRKRCKDICSLCAPVVLGLGYVCLALWYSLAVPVFEAPDEDAHYHVARHVAFEGRLVSLQRTSPGRQEAGQPPLYYFLVTPLLGLFEAEETLPSIERNDQGNMGHPMAAGNKNCFLHGPSEEWPWRPWVLAVRSVRFLSIGLGLCTVLLTYRLGLLVLGDRLQALAATVCVGFLPQFLFISGAISNDNLVTTLSAAAVLLMVRNAMANRRGHANPWAVGAVVGLAWLSKSSGMLLLPLAYLSFCLRPGRRRERYLAAIRSTAVALVFAGPWMVRNVVEAGDPLAFSVFIETAGGRSVESIWAGLRGEARGLLMSLWGLFGWFSIPMPSGVYTLLNASALLSACGMAVGVAKRRHLSLISLLLIAWPALVLAGLLCWTTLTPGSQGRLLFPALPALGVLLASGWRGMQRGRILVAGLPIALVGTAIVVPLWVLRPAYAHPALLNPDEVEPAREVNATFGGEMKLLGYDIDTDDVRAGHPFRITLYWQALSPIRRNYHVWIHLLGVGWRALAEVDTHPGHGTYPTSVWPVGLVVADDYQLVVGADLREPVAAFVDVGVYDRASGKAIPGAIGSRDLGLGDLGRVRVSPGEPPRSMDGLPLATFGEKIALLRAGVGRKHVRPGQAIPVQLEWRCLGEMNHDYHLFLHLCGQDAKPIAQADGPPREGFLPTTYWRSGDSFSENRLLQVPRQTSEGIYRVILGWYDWRSGVRLAATGDGVIEGNAFQVAEVTVGTAK